MIPVEWIDIRNKDMRQIVYPAIAQLKVDGELVAWNGYKRKLINSYGRDKDWVDTSTFPSDCMLFGELYYDTGKDFYDYLRHQFSVSLRVEFFDVISYKGEVLYGNVPYVERVGILEQVVTEKYQIVPSMSVHTKEEVEDLFESYKADGYEGIVVKPEISYTCREWVKLKRTYHDRLLVIGSRKGKDALLVGTQSRAYGSVSTIGWGSQLGKALKESGYVAQGEDKEFVYLRTDVVVEVKHYGFCGQNERESKLRNPSITKVCDSGTKLTLPR